MILSFEETTYKVELKPGNTVSLPMMDSYPPYFNILNNDFSPMFATIYIAKSASFTKPRLYSSRSETFITLEPVGFQPSSFMRLHSRELKAQVFKRESNFAIESLYCSYFIKNDLLCKFDAQFSPAVYDVSILYQNHLVSSAELLVERAAQQSLFWDIEVTPTFNRYEVSITFGAE